MAINVKGRLKRIEKMTLKRSTEWIALIKDDNVNVLLVLTGKNIIMTALEFDKWKKNNPEGKTLQVEWI